MVVQSLREGYPESNFALFSAGAARSRGPWDLRDARKVLFSCFFGPFFYKKNMKMVDDDGWMLEFRAESDTK